MPDCLPSRVHAWNDPYVKVARDAVTVLREQFGLTAPTEYGIMLALLVDAVDWRSHRWACTYTEFAERYGVGRKTAVSLIERYTAAGFIAITVPFRNHAQGEIEVVGYWHLVVPERPRIASGDAIQAPPIASSDAAIRVNGRGNRVGRRDTPAETVVGTSHVGKGPETRESRDALEQQVMRAFPDAVEFCRGCDDPTCDCRPM